MLIEQYLAVDRDHKIDAMQVLWSDGWGVIASDDIEHAIPVTTRMAMELMNANALHVGEDEIVLGAARVVPDGEEPSIEWVGKLAAAGVVFRPIGSGGGSDDIEFGWLKSSENGVELARSYRRTADGQDFAALAELLGYTAERTYFVPDGDLPNT